MLARIVLTGLLVAPLAWSQEVPTVSEPEAWTADLSSGLKQRAQSLLQRAERLRSARELLLPGQQ